ncbi:MAG: pitrilysin family protein [Oscillospiraceae bacterium]|mgnify:FL=1|nr:pitrilysin family protein [Oscillospiraceae bacterium]
MNERIFPGLGEKIYEDTLPNGLRIKVVPKRGFARSYAFFATDYGSMDTRFRLDGKDYVSPDGVAHYLEHKMFDMPDGNALQKMSQTGASPNAFTSYNITAYHFSCTSMFEENFRTLLQFVSQGYFTQESVEKERGIIAQEIKMYADNPASRVDENLFCAMYRNHPIRVPVAGTVESIQDITAQTLIDCHRAFYDPSNMVLCVVGDVDPRQIHDIALEILPKVPGGASERDYGEKEPAAPDQHTITQEMEVSMPMFSVGFKGAEVPKGPQRLRQEIIGDLAGEILCGESSRLYQEMYESGLIDPGFGVSYSLVRELSMLCLGGDSENPQAVLDAVLQEAQRVVKEGVDEELFLRLKRSAVGRRIRGLDSFEGLCYRLALSDFDGYDYFTFPTLYESITAEDVRQLIAREITPEQAVLSVILPKTREE